MPSVKCVHLVRHQDDGVDQRGGSFECHEAGLDIERIPVVLKVTEELLPVVSLVGERIVVSVVVERSVDPAGIHVTPPLAQPLHIYTGRLVHKNRFDVLTEGFIYFSSII